MPVKRVIALRWRLSSFASWGFYIWELWRCAKITKLYTQTHTGWNKRPKAISSGVYSVKEILSHNCSVCFFRCRVGNVNERDSWSREHTNNRPWDFFLLIHCKGAFTKQTNLSKVALANTACRMWPSQSWQNAANRFFFYVHHSYPKLKHWSWGVHSRKRTCIYQRYFANLSFSCEFALKKPIAFPNKSLIILPLKVNCLVLVFVIQ